VVKEMKTIMDGHAYYDITTKFPMFDASVEVYAVSVPIDNRPQNCWKKPGRRKNNSLSPSVRLLTVLPIPAEEISHGQQVAKSTGWTQEAERLFEARL